MNKKYNFSTLAKLNFYIHHIYYKLRISLDCTEGKISIITAEIILIVNAILKMKMKLPKRFLRSEFVTKFGMFSIEPELTNTIIVSPAFERLDIEYLLALLKKEIMHGKKILFLDVGAHFGTYTIPVGNLFKEAKGMQIYAFEPDSIMFSLRSFSLLQENIKKNHIKNVKLFHIGLGEKDTNVPNKIGIVTKKLDSVVNPSLAKQFDVVFMKIDIEGCEKEALEGAQKFIKNAKRVVLQIEDCVDKSIVSYLEKDFVFYNKLTPYNSFWVKEESK
jgi:hypothetical protein